MKLNHACRGISKLTLGIVGVFCFLSLLFVGAYLYIDYQRYLASSKATQLAELKSAQEKISLNLENMKKLSALTVKRIAAVSGDRTRIQNILLSSHALLPDSDFLKILKVTYEKLSPPQCLITRFGVVPHAHNKQPLNGPELVKVPADKGPTILIDQDSVYARTWVFDQEDTLEGVLEIHVASSHFKETLRIGSTLSFIPGAARVLLQKNPFPLYGNLPESFWGYFVQQIDHYSVFLLFIIFAIIFIATSNIYSRFYIQRDSQEERDSLRDQLAESQRENNKANDALLTSQKRTETHQVTCQSYKQFQTNFLVHQREQLNHVLRSLDVVMRSLQNQNASLSSQETVEILKSCLNVVEHVSSGTPLDIKREPIRIHKTLANIRSLFTEKMYKSDFTMEVHCPEELVHYGDSLTVEFVLLNLIGKPLYMVPKNGKVEVRASDQKGALQIQVKDNGFPINEKSQKQLQQAFEFFISEGDFQQLCQDNGFYYEYTKDKDGLNRSTILLPKVGEESPHNNVIPLFNKS